MHRLPCPPELWPAFSQLLDEALELPESARLAWVDALGEQHAAVKPWLRKLLGDTREVDDTGFLEAPLVRELPNPEFSAQQRVGPYVLEQLLGRGGMGEVWLASRADGELKRGIALKLPHAHLLAGVQRRRFERERDILAMLAHPHIAQLYDAGVAEDTQPFLAMECISGVPITQYCLDHRLPLAERIGLFRQVLDAVGYAHARLIAHRDLKPSNVLVTADGQVKLLDFGIAKLLAADGSADGNAADGGLTELTGRAATPDYAAPEQLRGEPVTAAADIYALGVMLFEVLAGRRPHARVRRDGMPPDSAPRASTLIEPARAAEVGGCSPKQLRRALQGDLDAILAKALDPNPQQRYRTAEAFAEDLQASLDRRPISARHIRLPALAWRFVQRHRLGTALVAALVLTLVIGSAGIAWQAVRAQREAQRAVAIKDFLVSMFRASDPSIASDKPRGTMTAKDLIDLNVTRIERDFAGEPEVAVDLLGVAASIYSGLEEDARYQDVHARQAALALKVYGADSPVTIRIRLADVDRALREGEHQQAGALLDELDQRLHALRQDRSPLRGHWALLKAQWLGLAPEHQEQRRELLEQAIPLLARDTDRSDELTALNERGQYAVDHRDYADAVQWFRRSIDAAAQLRIPNDRGRQRAYSGLGTALAYLNRVEEARAAFDEAQQLALRTYGTHNWRYWITIADYAALLHQRGERAQADAMFESLLPLLPSPNQTTASADNLGGNLYVRTIYASALINEGRGNEALRVLADTGEARSDIVRLRLQLYAARARLELGELSAAREQLQRCVDGLATLGKLAAFDEAVARERLGQALLRLQLPAAATEEFARSHAAAAPGSLLRARAAAGLAQAALARGEVEEGRRRADEALAELAQAHATELRAEPVLLRVQAESLLAAGDVERALPLAEQAQLRLQQYNDPASSELAAATATLQRVREASSAKRSDNPAAATPSPAVSPHHSPSAPAEVRQASQPATGRPTTQ